MILEFWYFFDRGSLAYSFFLFLYFFNSVHLHGCCLVSLFLSVMTVYLFVLRLLYFLEMWKYASSLRSIVALWLTASLDPLYEIFNTALQAEGLFLFRFILDLIKHARTRGEKQYKRDKDEYLNSKTNEFFLAHKYTSCESKSYFFKYPVKWFLIWSQISVLLLLLKAVCD